MGSLQSASSPLSGGLASAVNLFGNTLFNKLKENANPGDNVFISPYGIARALGMLLNGVEPGGDSYRQLQEVVFGAAAGDALALDALNAQLKQLRTSLVKEPTDNLAVSDANSAWVAQKYQLQQAYAQSLKAAFGAEAAPITTAGAINAWVSEATHGKIAGIVDEGAVRQATLILINATYFKGMWLHPFNKKSSSPQEFFPLAHSSTTLQAATMYQIYKPGSKIQTAMLPVVANGGTALVCPAVVLPYKASGSSSEAPVRPGFGTTSDFYGVLAMPGGEFSVVAAEDGSRGLVTPGGATLPYSKALAACRMALLTNLPRVQGSSSNLWQQEDQKDIKLFLPRFEVEFFASLNQSLNALGLRKPFEGGDITRIAADSSGNAIGDLYVSDVLHKVYAKVDETGTEAAAMTAIMMPRCAMPMPREELELRFNRPFVFAVVYAPSGLALFCGEVHRPEAS